jgi:hypothetical protein
MRRTSTWDARRILTVAGIAVSLFIVIRLGLGYMFSSGETHNAQERVRRVFDGMKAGGDLQKAICLWYLGTFSVPGGQEQFNQAADAFEAWQAESELASVTSYEITESKIVEQSDQLGEAVVVVRGTLNGKPFAMRVRAGQPLAWTR